MVCWAACCCRDIKEFVMASVIQFKLLLPTNMFLNQSLGSLLVGENSAIWTFLHCAPLHNLQLGVGLLSHTSFLPSCRLTLFIMTFPTSCPHWTGLPLFCATSLQRCTGSQTPVAQSCVWHPIMLATTWFCSFLTFIALLLNVWWLLSASKYWTKDLSQFSYLPVLHHLDLNDEWWEW